MVLMPNPGLRSNFWVRLPTTYLLEDPLSLPEAQVRVQFKNSIDGMGGRSGDTKSQSSYREIGDKRSRTK